MAQQLRLQAGCKGGPAVAAIRADAGSLLELPPAGACVAGEMGEVPVKETGHGTTRALVTELVQASSCARQGTGGVGATELMALYRGRGRGERCEHTGGDGGALCRSLTRNIFLCNHVAAFITCAYAPTLACMCLAPSHPTDPHTRNNAAAPAPTPGLAPCRCRSPSVPVSDAFGAWLQFYGSIVLLPLPLPHYHHHHHHYDYYYYCYYYYYSCCCCCYYYCYCYCYNSTTTGISATLKALKPCQPLLLTFG